MADAGATPAGVNVTLTVQEAPAAMLAPQVLEGEAKLAALVPVKEMLAPENGIGSEVLFVSVTVFAALVTPTGWVPKARLVGDTASVGISVSFAINASDVPFKVF